MNKSNLYILTTLCCLLLGTHNVFSQKVGLVLSGGGAKGITHIGLIKALEENGIPIDYIAGTSMGAIIGGFYAAGLSPDDMIKLLKSTDFKRWSSGEVEQKYIYYYKDADPFLRCSMCF
ncbi:MAG: patatin-like phospholipase family protein [Paludibacteraceae bacterium]